MRHIKELESMKSYPKTISYSGDLSLLDRKKISIIGSRKPSMYSQEQSIKLASLLGANGCVVVSGGALGVDSLSHKSAKPKNTIAVLPCGIDVRYPVLNKNLLDDIAKDGLLLSQFEPDFKATPWSFVARNEMVVALGEKLIVTHADLGSGSLRSIEFALKMKKEIYVLPHRLGESVATNELLKNALAKAIYDIEEFVYDFCGTKKPETSGDEFLEFCKTNPTYEEAILKYASRVFSAELSGEIEIKNAKVYLL